MTAYTKSIVPLGWQRHRSLHRCLSTLCLVIIFWAMLSTDTHGAGDVEKKVTVSKLETVNISPIYDAPASVVSLNDAKVSAQIDGVVQDIKIKVGDSVKHGDPIALLDCEKYEVAMRQATAELDAANAKFSFAESQSENATKLSANRSIAREELDARKSEKLVAQAEVDRSTAYLMSARNSVRHCQIRSPFSGVVVERIASVGDYAVTGTPIIRLLDSEQLEVAADAQQQDLESLRQSTQLVFSDRQDDYEVTIRSVLPIVDSKMHTYEVRLSFVGSTAVPGATGRLQWQGERRYIPSQFLVHRGDELGVFLVVDGRAQFYPIAEAREGKPALSDLPGDELVIVDGRFSVRDGDRVEWQGEY